MRIKVTSYVEKDFNTVIDHFNNELFVALTPPLMKMEMLQSGSIEKGSMTEFKLHAFPFKQYWLTKIIDKTVNPGVFKFVDEGMEIPYPFKTWKHQHIVQKKGNGVMITDDVEMTGKHFIPFIMLLPGLYFAFLYRKFAYNHYFRNI